MKTFRQFIREAKLGPEDVLTDKNGDTYIVQREDYKDNHDTNRIRYEVRPHGKSPGTWVIGGVTMSAIHPKQAMSVNVNGQFQRRGIASALYKYIENDLGFKLEPNWALTDDGEAFWKSRK
jgi:hypothetical protein